MNTNMFNTQFDQNQHVVNAETSINNEKKVSAASKTRKSNHIQPVYHVLKGARKLFNNQLDKDSMMKKRCIEVALQSNSKLYSDPLRFDLDFRAERERLLDSKRFEEACIAINLKPEDVADHVLFEGKAILEKVLREGLQVIGEKARMFKAPLWEDKQSLYNNEKKEIENA